ncbi:MAG: 4Fe-4S dicluster domain-containing protein [Mogibacterium sp.]|nr:4Fe-4S dicluster domain-containing protein [Mogibacterium sp.]
MNYAEVEVRRCKACERCMDVCPKHCFEHSGKANDSGYDYIVFKEGSPCIACGMCYIVCPDVAISVYKG